MSPQKRKGLLIGFLLFGISHCLFAEGFAESVSLRSKNIYLGNNGSIVDPKDIYADSYIASFNYGYPKPESDIGVNVYNKLNEATDQGQEGLLQIGVQGKIWGFADLPALNLVLVIDTSISMNEDDKLFWFKNSMKNFIKKIRPIDSLALVGFNNTAEVVFEPTLMASAQTRRLFLNAVNGLVPQGNTNLEAGLILGYEQVIPNFKDDSINLVLLFSDGDEFSARLAQASAHSGDIRISLIWNNRNDLDLHVITPNGEEINFKNMQDSTGGWLDVDRNLYGETDQPVENVFWPQGEAPLGAYQVFVQNYDEREPNDFPTPFQVEIKNGKEYRYIEGAVQGSGRTSKTNVCTFEFTGTDTLDKIYQIAELRKQEGISLSTLGLGGNFDEELMKTLAEYGQGASRTLHSADVMNGMLNTDREFERLAVLAAQELDIALEFTSGIEILAAHGYYHRIKDNQVNSRVHNLRQGDYRTLLVRYRIPPQFQNLPIASLRITNQDAIPGVAFYTDGNTAPEELGSFNKEIILTEPPGDFAERMILISESALGFAEAVGEIGNHYYNGGGDFSRLEAALNLTAETGVKLETAQEDLWNWDIFTPELDVLEQYYTILNAKIAANKKPGEDTPALISAAESPPPEPAALAESPPPAEPPPPPESPPPEPAVLAESPPPQEPSPPPESPPPEPAVLAESPPPPEAPPPQNTAEPEVPDNGRYSRMFWTVPSAPPAARDAYSRMIGEPIPLAPSSNGSYSRMGR